MCVASLENSEGLSRGLLLDVDKGRGGGACSAFNNSKTGLDRHNSAYL